MSTDPDYGKLTKRIVFTDTEHQHAKLIIRLKHDGLRQADFFRSIIEGYVSGDSRIQDFAAEKGTHSQKRKAKSKKLAGRGKSIAKDLGLNEGEIDNIFDMIEQECPDL